MLRLLLGRPGFTRGVDAFEGERADALKAEALDKFCFLLAERVLLNFFALPAGVNFCFLKEVASCCFPFLPFGVFFLLGAILGVHLDDCTVSYVCVIWNKL